MSVILATVLDEFGKFLEYAALHPETEDLFAMQGLAELSPLLGTEEVQEVARVLLDRGAALVLVSLEPEGTFYATRDFSGDVPAFEVECVDAMGAGDALLAASLVHLSEGERDEARVRGP